jgi:hypothetical protein
MPLPAAIQAGNSRFFARMARDFLPCARLLAKAGSVGNSAPSTLMRVM